MSNKQHLYSDIWKSQSVAFKNFLETDVHRAEVQLREQDFQRASIRGRKSFSFNLVLENGKASNNISGSAVARDLEEYLTEHVLFRKLLADKHVKINLTGDFMLQMQKL